MAIKQHTYRFGKDCRPVYNFFHPRRKIEKRIFPSFVRTTHHYVDAYFDINRKAGYIAFVGS